jgi:hypothetical protein
VMNHKWAAGARRNFSGGPLRSGWSIIYALGGSRSWLTISWIDHRPAVQATMSSM